MFELSLRINLLFCLVVFFFKQKTAYEMRISDWSSDVCSSDLQVTDALTAIAEGDTPEIAKPMTGLGSGIWELAIKERGDAFRVIYALQLDDDIWVIHAFQKKSKSGIATPKQAIDLVRERIKRLRSAARRAGTDGDIKSRSRGLDCKSKKKN